MENQLRIRTTSVGFIILFNVALILCENILTSTFPFRDTLAINKQNYIQLIQIDQTNQFNSLRVTMNIPKDVTKSGIKPCLVLADSDVPSVYDVMKFFDSDQVKDQVDLEFKSNYYVDIQGCSMQDEIQFLQIDPPFFTGIYRMAIYDMSLSREQFSVDINIQYQYLSKNQLCPDTCSYFRYNEEKNQCIQGVCTCTDSFIGNRCQVKTFPLEDDGEKNYVVLDKFEWVSYELKVKDVTDSYTLNIIDLSFPANISIIKLGFSDIQVPNFYHDFYNMPQSGDQNYQIGDDMLKPYALFAERNPDAQTALVISFYNPNLEPIDFIFRISSNSFDDSASNSILQNVLVIVICVIGVICLIPFIYICISSLTKKNQQVQVNVLNPNMIQQQQQQGTNLIQGAIRMQQRCVSISKETVDKYMPITNYPDLIAKYPILKEISECIICLTEFDEKSFCRMTVCYHLFHKDCLEGWFKLHDNCPFCRKQLTEKAIKENKEKDVNNSYVHRITASLASDNNKTAANERLQEIDSPRQSGSRGRAISTEESSNFGSHDNILRMQIQKRSRFANQQEEGQEDYIIQDRDQSRQSQAFNVVDLTENTNNNVRDDFNNVLQSNDIHNARRYRSESAQIGQAQGDLTTIRNINNLPTLQIPQNVQNIIQALPQRQNSRIEEISKVNEDTISLDQNTNIPSLKVNNQLNTPERLINLEDEFSPSEISQQNIEQNERSPLSQQRNKYNPHNFNPSNKKRVGSSASNRKKFQSTSSMPMQVVKAIQQDQQPLGISINASLYSQNTRNNNSVQEDSKSENEGEIDRIESI